MISFSTDVKTQKNTNASVYFQVKSELYNVVFFHMAPLVNSSGLYNIRESQWPDVPL